MCSRRHLRKSRGSALGLALLLTCGLLPGGARAQAGSPVDGPSLTPGGPWVGMGLLNLHQADDLASPLRYGGTSWNAVVGFDVSTAASIRMARLSYSGAELTSSASEAKRHRQSGYWADVRASYFRKLIAPRGGRFSLLAGGVVSLRYSFYDHWYTEQERETWIHGSALLEPGVGWHIRFADGAVLWQEVTIPLGGMVLRSPYQGLTELPSPAWEGPGGVKGVRQAIHYHRGLGSRWAGGISYAFEGVRYAEPRPLAWTRHTLVFHLTLWAWGSR